MQLFATVLSDVCYRLHGIVEGKRQSKGVDARHFLRDLFERRLRQGRCFRTPCFGWSEFTCSYWGPFRCEKIVRHDGELEDNEAWKAYCKEWNLGFRDETEVDDALSMEIPSMVLAVWGQPTRGNYAPTYRQDVRIREGVLEFDLPAEWGRELDLQEASGAE